MNEQDGEASLVRSDALLDLWVAAFEAFQLAITATRIGYITGDGFDRAARMWDDFEKIVGQLKPNDKAQKTVASSNGGKQ